MVHVADAAAVMHNTMGIFTVAQVEGMSELVGGFLGHPLDV
jgi:hypothetical protein